MIPLVDLHAQYINIKKEIDTAIATVLARGDFILGQEVTDFEHDFARFVGARFCVGVGSGTDAIRLMLLASGIGPGDEVIVQANTFIATLLPILDLGATPVLVDCAGDGSIDIDAVESAITKRTRAILPVHLYGTPAPVPQLTKLQSNKAAKPLLILEDCAQAVGTTTTMQGRTLHVGLSGAAAAFSFYPGKNLGAYGDGGAVVTNDQTLADKIRVLANIGQDHKYHHIVQGVNSRLDTIQAAILRVKLKHLKAWNAARSIIARRYIAELTDVGDLRLPSALGGNWHLFVIRTKHRDALQKFLAKKGVATGIHYPTPLHLTPALKQLGYKKGNFPIAEARAATMLSLPIYAELDDKQQTYIIKTIRRFYDPQT